MVRHRKSISFLYFLSEDKSSLFMLNAKGKMITQITYLKHSKLDNVRGMNKNRHSSCFFSCLCEVKIKCEKLLFSPKSMKEIPAVLHTVLSCCVFSLLIS